LTLFIGHIKLNDENGQLILSLLSHLQVFIGSKEPIISLPFEPYKKWVEVNWVTSIWWFTSILKVTLDIEQQWLPKLARINDAMIMDTAPQYNFSPTQLHQINSNRIYLQVLMISNITSANSHSILPCIIQGQRIHDCRSSLQWPYSACPIDWTAWQLLLQHLVQGNTLLSPLGEWLNNPHQHWEWFYCLSEDTVFHHSITDSTWCRFHKQQSRIPYARRTHKIS
jgi:hypothetical protein